MEVLNYVILGVSLVALVAICLIVKWILGLRRVVPTDEVHIVRSSKGQLVYGTPQATATKELSAEEIDQFKSQFKGNSYYEWPVWVPKVGVSVRVLPLKNIKIPINGYDAYDVDKVPFNIDILAWFCITDFATASERITDISTLMEDLRGIVQGAARSILGKDEIRNIMIERAKYTDQFTEAVSSQVSGWGVKSVKSVELMDVRDAQNEVVIANIMKEKKAAIDMKSRTAVAENEQKAREAEISSRQELELREINSQQAVALREEDKKELVGKRQADVTREVGISTEKSNQEVEEQKKITTEKKMNVLQVETVRKAEIVKQETIVKANADREKAEVEKKTTIVNEEAAKEKKRLEAEADLVTQQNKAKELEVNSAAELVVKQNKAKEITVEAEAKAEQVKLEANANSAKVKLEGSAEADVIAIKAEAKAKQIDLEGSAEASVIAAKGQAEADAESSMQKAKVAGEIDLAKEIGENEGYQGYLIQIQQIKSGQEVGIANAVALEKAGIKMLIQNGEVGKGIESIKDIFAPKGAAAITATLEALDSSEIGKTILKKVGLGSKEEKSEATDGEVKFEEVK